MPGMKRIKCAGEADEQLIADLENQLESHGREEEYIQERDTPYHDDEAEEESSVLLYVVGGIILGIIILFCAMRFAPKEHNIPEAETVSTQTEPEAEMKKDFAFTEAGLRPVEDADKGFGDQAKEFVSNNALALGALAGGAVAYQQGHLDGMLSRFTPKAKAVIQRAKAVIKPPTAAECRARGQVLKGKSCVPTTWSENFTEKVEDTAHGLVNANANMVDAAGKMVNPNLKVTGYLGNWGALGVTAVCGVASVIGLKYAYDYFMGEKGADPKKNGVATKDADKTAKKEDKKEGEKKSTWMLYSAIAALFAAFIWFLPAISAFFGLQGYLGAVTGPITSGKGAVLGLLGMAPAGGLLPAP